MRFRSMLILLGALLIVLVYSFPLWQPFFLNEGDAPEEIFPGLDSALADDFRILPPEQQDAYREVAQADPARAVAMVEAALATGVPAPESERELPVMTGPVVAAQGEFGRINLIRWGEGTVTIYQQADEAKILRLEDFSVANGPNLHVVLSATANPLADPNDEESQDDILFEPGDIDIDLGPLRGTYGNQNYDVPREVNLAEYASVIIYSRDLNLTYAFAPLIVRL